MRPVTPPGKFGRKDKIIQIHPSVAKQFEIQPYLKTTWTSLDTAQFEEIVSQLPTDLSVRGNHIQFGFKSVFKTLAQNSFNVLAVMAVIDTGRAPGNVINKLCSVCFENGVPVVLGKGARVLAHHFGNKKIICCLALLRPAASVEGLSSVLANLADCASHIQITPEEDETIVEKLTHVLGHSGDTMASSNSMDHRMDNQTNVDQSVGFVKQQKPTSSPQQAAKKQKLNNNPKKPGNFLSSFD